MMGVSTSKRVKIPGAPEQKKQRDMSEVGRTVLQELGDVPELAVEMMSFLDISDIHSVLLLSKHWKTLASSDSLWRAFIHRDCFDGKMFHLKTIGQPLEYHVAQLRGDYVPKESAKYEVVKDPTFSGGKGKAKEYYKKHLVFQKEKRVFMKSNFLTPENEPMSINRNNGQHLIGLCMRGELDKLKQYIKANSHMKEGKDVSYRGACVNWKDGTTVEGDKSDPLNSKDCYKLWGYYGNYSGTHGAVIRLGAPANGSDMNWLGVKYMEVPTFEEVWRVMHPKVSVFYPSIESNHCRMPALEFPQDQLGTPLHWAALAGQLEVVKWLCEEAFVDVNATVDRYKATAFDIAVTNGFTEVARYLESQMKTKGAAKV